MAQPALAETSLEPSPTPAATPSPRRRKGKKRARAKKPVLRLVASEPRYFAVMCGICEVVGPIATTPLMAINPPRALGWVERPVCALWIWMCRVCNASYRRRLPPATRGDCIDGPRPCPHTLCRYHMVDAISRKAPADFELTETCALDVVDKHDEGMTLNDIGELLSMTREGSRYCLLVAMQKLRAAGIDMEDPVEPEEHPLVQWAHE